VNIRNLVECYTIRWCDISHVICLQHVFPDASGEEGEVDEILSEETEGLKVNNYDHGIL